MKRVIAHGTRRVIGERKLMVALICIYLFLLYLIKREIKINDQKEKRIFLICTLISCSLAIPFRMYLIQQGYEYGLANLDMQCYMSLANQIKDMSIPEGFRTIANHWNFTLVNDIQMWGYRIYIYFLVLTIYRWTILPVEISVFLVSILQLLIAAYSTLRIYNSIKPRFIKYNVFSLFVMLIAPSIWYACVRLLRDVFMLLSIAIMISAFCRKERYWQFKIIVSMALLVILRPYYALLMCPLLLMLIGKESWSMIVEIGIFAILAVICAVKRIGPATIIGVVLSPNFFNQSKTVWQDALEVTIQGGQIPIINFIGSIWNFIMVIYAMISLGISKKLNLRCWCSLGLMLDISMIYAISYGGATELRHKMFFVIPLVILLNNGDFSFLGSLDNQGRQISRQAFVVNFSLVMFLVICFLLYGFTF